MIPFLSFRRTFQSSLTCSVTVLASSTPVDWVNLENQPRVSSETGHNRAARSRSCAQVGSISPSNQMIWSCSRPSEVDHLSGTMERVLERFVLPRCGSAGARLRAGSTSGAALCYGQKPFLVKRPTCLQRASFGSHPSTAVSPDGSGCSRAQPGLLATTVSWSSGFADWNKPGISMGLVRSPAGCRLPAWTGCLGIRRPPP